MVQVSLYCAIVGVPRSTFVVDIDTDRSVAHLKDAIKAKNAVDVLCDARELRLYLAKKDVVWLPDDDDLDKLIQTEGFFDGMEEMRASWELSDPSLFGTGVLLGNKVVHVLVVLPPTMPVPQGGAITMGGVTFPFMQTMEAKPTSAIWSCSILHTLEQRWFMRLAKTSGHVPYFQATRWFKDCGRTLIKCLRSLKPFYVVDGVEPSRCDAKTILVTSPRKKIWHKYSQRNGAKVLFMPVWTEEEIYRCSDLLYSDTPVETVEKRFCKWGGVARYVLRYAKDKAKQKVLKEAIGQADLKLILSASVESSGVECDVSHRLLHFRVTRDFGYERFDFATNYIAEKVFHTLYQRNRIELIDFLSASYQLNDVAGFRGILFERYALSVLSQGGTFEFRRLNKERRVSVTNGDTNESKSECFVNNAGGVTMDDRAAVERIKLRPRTTLFFKHTLKWPMPIRKNTCSLPRVILSRWMRWPSPTSCSR
uniref:RxLR effector candidate protein n=1 Tax=Hyaloperonospora arabidopsidis (strain Emoy2) TaxID=559515 RepID=M4BC58_HYAAE|nr:RxLR effector candidate protein [Hyaloperonospora arabidopsidis Emoy2]